MSTTLATKRDLEAQSLVTKKDLEFLGMETKQDIENRFAVVEQIIDTLRSDMSRDMSALDLIRFQKPSGTHP